MNGDEFQRNMEQPFKSSNNYLNTSAIRSATPEPALPYQQPLLQEQYWSTQDMYYQQQQQQISKPPPPQQQQVPEYIQKQYYLRQPPTDQSYPPTVQDYKPVNIAYPPKEPPQMYYYQEQQVGYEGSYPEPVKYNNEVYIQEETKVPAKAVSEEYLNQDSEEYKKKKKTRKRLSVSCRTCRQKKIKCDRSRPNCGSCTKNKLPSHLCIYDDSPWVSSLVQEQNLYSEIENLKDQQRKLKLILEMEQERNEVLNRAYTKSHLQYGGGVKPVLDHVAESYWKNLKNVRINISKFATTKKTEKYIKTFGPLSWQNILFQNQFNNRIITVLEPMFEDFKQENQDGLSRKRALTTHLFDFKLLFPFDNLAGRKIEPNLKPYKNDVIGRKLQEVASYLPSYKYLERKIKFQFETSYANLYEQYFDIDIILKDFKRIFKKTRKGGVEINVYEPGRDYSIELAKLALLLFLIKFGIVYGDENSNAEFDDSVNVLVPSAVACVFLSNCFVSPSIAAINVFLFACIFKSLNPDDLGDEVFPEGSPNDTPFLLNMAYNMVMALGLWKPYEELESSLKDKDNADENYITESHLKAMWKNFYYLDGMAVGSTGNTLSLLGFTKEQELLTDDIFMNHTVVMRHYYGKYTILSYSHEDPLSGILEEGFECSSQAKKLTRLDIELDTLQLKKHYTMLQNLQKIDDHRKLVFTLNLLDLSCSLNYLLYFSCAHQHHPVNEFNPINIPDDMEHLLSLRVKYMNQTLLQCIYALRLLDHCIQVDKNEVWQIGIRPLIKKIVMKTMSVVVSIMGDIRNGVSDEMDLSDLEVVSLFQLPMDKLEECCLGPEVNRIFYSNGFNVNFCQLISSVYEKIQMNKYYQQDITWFAIFQEYYYLITYFVNDQSIDDIDFPNYYAMKHRMRSRIEV